jgi:DNA-binding CsgD family transcriptional regulator
MKIKKWSEDDVKQLIELAKGHSDEEIAEKLGRSLISVTAKRNRLGVKKYDATGRWWTQADTLKLSELSMTKTDEEMAELFGRSVNAVKDRRVELGIAKFDSKSRKWTKQDFEQFEQLVLTKTDEEISKIMNRTPVAIAHKRAKHNPSYSLWSEADEVLKKWGLKKLDHEIGEMLGRTGFAVKTKRKELGIKSRHPRAWSESEINKLREIARDHTFAELGRIFGRRGRVVAMKCSELNLKTKSLGVKRWTEEEDRLLYQLTAQGLPDKQIAAQIGRPRQSIRSRRFQLKELSEATRTGKWTPEEIEKLRRMYLFDGSDAKLISIKLGRTKGAVLSQIKYLKL